MNIDNAMQTLEEGQTVPGTQIQRVLIDDKLLNSYGLRRPKGTAGKQSHIVWCVGVGELQQPSKAFFYDFKLRKALQKALDWKQPKQEGAAG